MMAVKFKEGIKLFVVREYAVMRDGTMMVKIMDKEGKCIWTEADALEVFND